METRYNCVLTVTLHREYDDMDGNHKEYDHEVDIPWTNCSEGELMSLVHLLRPNMTLAVEVSNG